ncbi:MAG: type II toxin-antitoxin system VapC family toxin [Bacillota bacterium]|nr:type II toxin-antitoxin system VapC family toxin [Bacillota bacterium]
MRVLLDTHAFLWWITEDPRLSAHASRVIADGKNTILLSAASAWEIAIKARLGRIEVAAEDLGSFISGELARNAIQPLPILISHALHVHTLPDHHRDPFDRLLVAQAQLEQLPILTSDQQIAHYPVEVIW